MEQVGGLPMKQLKIPLAHFEAAEPINCPILPNQRDGHQDSLLGGRGEGEQVGDPIGAFQGQGCVGNQLLIVGKQVALETPDAISGGG